MPEASPKTSELKISIQKILTRSIVFCTLGAYPLTASALTEAPSMCNVRLLKTMAATKQIAMAAEPLSVIIAARVTIARCG